MARLPKPGADHGKWGDLLNEYLSVAHDSGGMLNPGTVSDDQVVSISQSKVLGLSASLSAKANNAEVVHTSGDETIAGNKTFSGQVVVPSPTDDTHVATKAYVDDATSSSFTQTDLDGKVSKNGDTMTGSLGLPASGYLNFGVMGGANGYGIRDNSGALEYKATGGSWAPLGATSIAQNPVVEFNLQVLGSPTVSLTERTPLYYHKMPEPDALQHFYAQKTFTSMPITATTDIVRFGMKTIIDGGTGIFAGRAIYPRYCQITVVSVDGTQRLVSSAPLEDSGALSSESYFYCPFGSATITGSQLSVSGDGTVIRTTTQNVFIVSVTVTVIEAGYDLTEQGN